MQKVMEQLDLFGFPVEPPKPAKKKEPAARSASLPKPPAEHEIYQSVSEPEPIVEASPVITEEAPVMEEEIAAPVVIASEEVLPAEEPVLIETLSIEEPEPVVAVKVAKPAPTKVAGKRGRKSFREMDSEADLVEVPEEAVLQQKLYYSISEVAGWFKVNTSLLRFWENEFDILQPRKTRKGDRLFRVEDIKNLQLIYFLLRQRKFSIDGAKKYLKANKQEADKQAQLMQSLTKFRSFLLELKTNLTEA